MVDVARSKELAAAVRAQPKQCWRNCAMGLGHLLGAGLYVEGCAVACLEEVEFATPHAWLEIEGKVLDPTWDPPGVRYFPVARYGLSEILDLLDVEPELPLYFRTHDGIRDMGKAEERAWHSILMKGESNGTSDS